MNKLLDLLTSAGQSLDLDVDLDILESLAALHDAWTRYRSEELGFSISSVSEFIEILRTDAELFATLDNLDLDATGLKAKADSVAEHLGRIPEPLKKILLPLDHFSTDGSPPDSGEIEWELLDRGFDGTGGSSGSYRFEVGGSAQLVFEAGDSWPRESDQLPAGLLRIEIAGGVTGDAGAKIPFKAASLSAEANAVGNAQLHYFLNPRRSDQLYAAAIASGLRELCNPFSLVSVWDNMATNRLAGTIVRLDGESSIGIRVGVSEALSLGQDIGGTADITVGVNARIASDYEIHLSRESTIDGGMAGLKLSVSRSRLRQRGAGASLGVELDVSGLASRLREILLEHEGALQNVLAGYREFLTPGTYLKNKLSDDLKDAVDEVVSNDDWKALLKNTISLGLGEPAKSTKKQIKSQVIQLLTERLDGVADATSSTVDRTASKVLGKLELENTELGSEAKRKLTALLARYQRDLDEKVSALAEDKLEKLLAEIEAAGITVTGIENRANKALAGVREAIAKYETLLAKLIDGTAEAARQKIRANFETEHLQSEGRIVEVTATISALNDETQAAYDALLSGDFDNIVELLDVETPGLTIDKDQTALTRLAGYNARQGLTLLLLGFEFRKLSSFDANAQVTVDGSGRVSLLSSGTWKRIHSARAEERELRLVNVFEIAAGALTGNLSLGLSLDHRDENLKRKELVGFVTSLVDADLAPADSLLIAKETLSRWNAENDNNKVKADLSFALSFNHKETLSILCAHDRLNGGIPRVLQFELFERAYSSLLQYGVYQDHELEAVEEFLPRVKGGREKPKLLQRLFDLEDSSKIRSPGSGNPNQGGNNADRTRVTRVKSLYEKCWGFVKFIDALGDAYELDHSRLGLGDRPESEYLKLEKRANRQIKDWLSINTRFYLWIDEDINPTTLALISTVLATGREPGGDSPFGNISLFMQQRSGTRERVRLV